MTDAQTATRPGNFDAIVEDMVARHAAHKINTANAGTPLTPKLTASCSCGWASDVTSKDLRPQRAKIDEHLIEDVLPAWTRGTCWCGRAVLLGPLGRWFHAEQGSHGHTADALTEPR